MRIIFSTASIVLVSAMLVSAPQAQALVPPSASTAPSASTTPSASVAPSANAGPSASPLQSGPPSDPCMQVDPDIPECHDGEVFLTVDSVTDPVREWTIAVIGGVPNVDVVTVPDPRDGSILFTLIMSGGSAIVEMTATLPVGGQVIRGSCFELGDEVPHDVLVAPRQLVLEVVRGSSHECSYRSDLGDMPALTAPPTDSQAGRPIGSSGGLHIVLVLMAALMCSSLVAARARTGGRPGARDGVTRVTEKER